MRKLEKPKKLIPKKEVIIGRMRQKGGGYHSPARKQVQAETEFSNSQQFKRYENFFCLKVGSRFGFLCQIILSIAPVRNHFVSSAHQTAPNNGTHLSRKCRVDQYLPEITSAGVAPAIRPANPTMTRCPYFLQLQFDFTMRYNL